MHLAYLSASTSKLLDVWRVALMCFVCLLVAIASPVAHARTVLELDASKQPIALGDWGAYWINSGSQLGPDQVDASTTLTWLPTPERGIYPLKPGHTLWIRFTVPPAPDAERWVLEIPYPALDRASLYTKDRLGQFTEQRAGDLTAVNRWITPHRHPLLVVAFNAEEPTHYLLRLENAQGFSAPLRFINARYVLRSEQLISLFLGVYFGIAALGFATGLIGLVWLRDRAYLYYGMCSVLVGLTLAAITGVAALHLWPNSPNWADRSLVILGTLSLVSFTLLNATVVSLAERSKRLNTLVWAIALAGLSLSAALGITDSALRLKLVVPYLLLVIAMVLSVNLWAWRHGDRFGGWLLLSTLPFAVTWAISIARYLEWIPLSFATEQGGLASMVFQLPALLTVLILRSQQRRENRRRILGLDRVDPATGLITEQVFTERLQRMSARSERLKHKSVVVLIDIINTDQTLRNFGRKAADELPLRVASRLLSTIRDIDSAARLSEQRFGMLVEGPVSPQEAATLGPRIIARCLMPFKGLHAECVAQVRVAYALVPYQGTSSQSLMSRLDERLTAAGHADDKRAVFAL
jgi:two-component system, sensor histidine kinase LadS